MDPHYNLPSQREKSATEAAEGDKITEASAPTDPIAYWIDNHAWPAGHSDPGLEMSRLISRKRSSTKLSVDQASSQGTPSRVPRDDKSRPYQNSDYEEALAAAGAFMDKPDLVITKTIKDLCKKLLDTSQSVPKVSRFHDDVLEKTCKNLRIANKAQVIKDITFLIVASAQDLADLGACKLDILMEKVNSSWLKCLPFATIGKRPQPDYSVGFRKSAFSEEQLTKLSPLIGKFSDQGSVQARWDMYFPFLTCEVKCSAEDLKIADRQNMHSASVSIKGIVELFRLINQQQKLHQEILAFSVSHDNETVRIYGHYPLINGDKTFFYRHLIDTFYIAARDDKEKWTAYKFTKNIYDIFVPIHLKRLCDAIDKLPAQYNFDVDTSLSFPSQPERDSEDTKSVLSSLPNTDSTANSKPTSQSSAPTSKKQAPLRRG